MDASKINPRAWSTGALVEEIKDCIEGHKMLASVLSREETPVSKPANPALNLDVSQEEIEDWLNDIPLFR